MDKTEEFKEKLEKMIEYFPFSRRYKTDHTLSLNELTYVLRMGSEHDYSVNIKDEGFIVSIRESFIPDSWLVKNINLETIKYFEEAFEGQSIGCVWVNFVK